MTTATDLFCGAGGSSTGMAAAGIEIKLAANHWRLAIETHAANHPKTEHDCADIRQTHPSLYPKTDIFWASPECTNHSTAKGRKRKSIHQLDLWGNTQVDPDEERSRATMREVVEFSEYHHYPIVIVENVVDIRFWQFYEGWLQAMVNLGYEYRTLYLNSMFFGVPQSRDRWYTVFWRKGNKAPALDYHPDAFCKKCGGAIEAVQVWKKGDAKYGRYGKNGQYVYRCPQCGADVQPRTLPAASVIDWSLPAPRVADRDKPLSPKTLERIKVGLKKFAYPVILNMAFNTQNASIHDPLPTQTTHQSMGISIPPFLMSYYGRDDAQSPLDAPIPTITTNPHHSLVLPPFLMLNYTPGLQVSIEEPLKTITTQDHHSLVVPPFITMYNNNSLPTALSEPLPTVVAGGNHHYLTLPTSSASDLDQLVPECRFRMLEPQELKLGMGFPSDYVVLGNKKEQTKQIGNAVTCPVATWIAGQCAETLQ